MLGSARIGPDRLGSARIVSPLAAQSDRIVQLGAVRLACRVMHWAALWPIALPLRVINQSRPLSAIFRQPVSERPRQIPNVSFGIRRV